MIYFYIFPNYNLDTDDYDIIDPENSAKGTAPLKMLWLLHFSYYPEIMLFSVWLTT